MFTHGCCLRFVLVLSLSAGAVAVSHKYALSQPNPKKLRLGIAATSVGFLPIYAAYHRGFYKDEGFDLEIILMSLAAANNAFFKARSNIAPASPAWRSLRCEITRQRF